MQLKVLLWSHIRAHGVAYVIVCLILSIGFASGWSVASTATPESLDWLAWVVRGGDAAVGFWYTLLVSLGQMALMLFWMLAASFTRWTLPIPLAVILLQSYVMGCALHVFVLMDPGWLYRIALTGMYGIIILTSLPIYMMASVLCMEHGWEAGRRGGGLRERVRRQGAVLLLRNLLFLLICGIPSALVQCLIGSLING